MEIKQIESGGSVLQYIIDDEGHTGLRIIPKEKMEKVVDHREKLNVNFMDINAWRVNSLVQLHLSHHSLPSVSGSYVNSESSYKLRFKSQREEKSNGVHTIITELEAEEGYGVTHKLSRHGAEECFEVTTEFHNRAEKPMRLNLLSSFSLGHISPFAEDDAPEQIFLHRMRSAWSLEGRHCVDSLENVQLENSWTGFNNINRFGALGSRVISGFFPLAALEDRKNGVFWGALLCHNASWQFELGRDLDCAFFCGGLADRFFGHWSKDVLPGESFSGPKARMAVSTEGFDELCDRLAIPAVRDLSLPAVEEELPIVFNEWCTSWGYPTHESMLAVADRLKGSRVKYIVMDAGWSRKSGDVPMLTGVWNWEYNKDAFPQGIRETCRQIRQRGFIPGVWFEFEDATQNTDIYDGHDDWYLKLDGQVILHGERKFLDFSNPEVAAYLQKKVIDFLRDNEFGYMKIDYNGSVGLGCDGAESPGEGLRQHMDNVRAFFEKVHAELPELVIESCASGGFRLDPVFVGISSMSSFSDAHECEEIPILAANVTRLMLPRQCQIWAVLRPSDTPDRTYYTLSATFLGRMCFSGDMAEISDDQMAIATEAQEMYAAVSHIIKDGKTRLFRDIGDSYRFTTGAQASVRISADQTEALVVFHAFHNPCTIRAKLGAGEWELKNAFGSKVKYRIEKDEIIFEETEDMKGAVLHLCKK